MGMKITWVLGYAEEWRGLPADVAYESTTASCPRLLIVLRARHRYYSSRAWLNRQG